MTKCCGIQLHTNSIDTNLLVLGYQKAEVTGRFGVRKDTSPSVSLPSLNMKKASCIIIMLGTFLLFGKHFLNARLFLGLFFVYLNL